MHKEILPILMIVFMFAVAFYASPLLITNNNGQIISHWDFSGKANGWMDKTVAIYLLPLLTAILYFAFLLIPKIEVHTENLSSFKQQFWGFKVIFVFVMCAIFLATLIPNFGYWGDFDPLIIVIPAIALLFFYVGHMLNFTKQNYFIGVRTPWTLASEKVWDKTNKLASKLFWVCGILTFVSLLAPSDFRLWLVVIPLIVMAIAVYIYSLFEYRRIKKESAQKGKKRGK
ncbi:MAG: SdpI family protein [Candidatus Micrarchaeota archaeon]|nr:SdpI family protein [Candidatus Micrarchaeota archaeon]